MVEKYLFEMFSNTDNFKIEKNHCKTFIPKVVLDHLKALKTQFSKYFTSNIDFKKFSWIQKPFFDWLE